jgi:transglutaminase-like putative cysteine protease
MRATATGALRLAPTIALDAAPVWRRLLYIFTYLACLIAVQILHLAMDDLTLNIGFTAGLAAGFVYSYFLEPRYRSATIYVDSAITMGLAVYYSVLMQRDDSMYGNYMGILLGILMVALAFKSFSPGDFRFLLIPCTVCVMFSSVASYDLKFMLLLPLFLIFAGFALYISNQVEVAVRVAGTTGGSVNLPFTVDRGFFWQLLRVVAGILALSVTVHILVPHSSQANRSLILNASQRVEEDMSQVNALSANTVTKSGSGQAQVGLGDDFNLAAQGELGGSSEPVLRLKSNRNGYLRAQVYDVYTGSGWVQSPWLSPPPGKTNNLLLPEPISTPYPTHAETANTFGVPLVDFPSRRYAAKLLKQQGIKVGEDNIFSTNDTTELNFEIVRQEITLLQNQPSLYFSVYQPFRLENVSLTKGDRLLDQPYLDRAATLRADDLTRQHPKNFGFTVYALEPKAGPAKLKQVFIAGPDKLASHYTQLPLDAAPNDEWLQRNGITREQYRPVSQRLRNFAVTTASSDATDSTQVLSIWNKVQAIYKFLNNPDEFTYTRDYKQLNPQQEVTEAFVMGSREGYCRYFASAMAVLCRLNGIAARVVTGYSPGSFSLVDNAYIVKSSNAHAWVEIYFDEYGWITFDPTPASQDVVTRGATSERITSVIDFLQELFVLDPAGTQKTMLAALVGLYQYMLLHWQVAVLAAVLLALAILAYFGLRLIPHRQRSLKIAPENAVVAQYLALSAELARIGVVKEPAQTPRMFLDTVMQRHQDQLSAFLEFTPAYERAAYSIQPIAETDLRLGEQAVTAARTLAEAELARRKKR